MVKQQRMLEDDPPPVFSELRDFRQPWREWSPREEGDYVRWCLIADGTSYNDAYAEMREVVLVPTSCPQPALALARSADPEQAPMPVMTAL